MIPSHTLRRSIGAVVLAFALALLLGAPAQALMVPLDESDLARGADEIVRGQVTGVSTGWNAERTHIVTTASVKVVGRAKGTGGDTIEIAALGGTADGITQRTEDQPLFIPGSEAYFFMKDHPGRPSTIYGGSQGVVPVRNGHVPRGAGKGRGVPVAEYDQYLRGLAAGTAIPSPAAVEPAVPAAAGTPSIASVVPDTASAGTESRITITGSGFGTKASRESIADVGFLYRYQSSGATTIWVSGYPLYAYNVDDIVSWSDTEIVVNVPTGITSDHYPGGASSGYVFVITETYARSTNVPFTVTFGYGKERWETDAPFYVNPGSEAPGVATAIQNAAGTWNGAVPPSSPFQFDYRGTSGSTTFGRDGQSLIYFGPETDFYDPNIIAWATSWTSTGGTIVEADIEFNSKWVWTTGTASGDTMNVETVVLHELGHWLCLTDLYGWMPGYPSDVGKVMFGYNNDKFGNKNLKTLHRDDAAGIRWIYDPQGTTPTPTVTITPTPTVQPVPGGNSPPTDTNNDGLYDDVNGNLAADFADIVLYFTQMDWIIANEPLAAFDYNGNGSIDFADVIWLFDHL